MQDLFQKCYYAILMSFLCVCNTSSRSNRTKTLEVPVNSIISLTDGRQHFFHLSSEFIAKNPLVRIESSENLAQFFVSVTDTDSDYQDCKKNISITISVPVGPQFIISSFNMAPIFLCYKQNQTSPLWLPGRQVTMDFSHFSAARRKSTELHVLRYLKTTKNGDCQNNTDYQCGRLCFGEDAMCDGQEHCRRGSDERNCSLTRYWKDATSSPDVDNVDNGHCDLSGSTLYNPHEKPWAWYVVAYSTGIIISTLFCSLLMGFCFMPSYLDLDDIELEQEDRRRDANEDGQRRLDPLLDHPPSYEDVLSMDLAAAPHQHAIPKQQSLDSP